MTQEKRDEINANIAHAWRYVADGRRAILYVDTEEEQDLAKEAISYRVDSITIKIDKRPSSEIRRRP